MDASQLPSLTPRELKARLANGDNLFLLDVREPYELTISKLPNVHHIPMDFVPSRLSELPKDVPIVVICRTGNRSTTISDFLRSEGFQDVYNLETGMNGWARTVDPRVISY